MNAPLPMMKTSLTNHEHNITKCTQTNGNGIIEEITDYQYEYNSEGYPTKKIEKILDSNTSITTYYYYK